MKPVIKGCKSRQLRTGAPLPTLSIPCGKEQISQRQGKKKLLSGQRTVCKHFRMLRGQGEKATTAVVLSSPRQQVPEGEAVGVTDSPLKQLVLGLSWLQTSARVDEPNQIRAGYILYHHLSQRGLLIHLVQHRQLPNICI